MSAAPEEIAKFERLGAMWHDPNGPMRVLHALNPLRTRAAAQKAGQVIDYHAGTTDTLRDEGRQFDAVCALEVVEHVGASCRR